MSVREQERERERHEIGSGDGGGCFTLWNTNDALIHFKFDPSSSQYVIMVTYVDVSAYSEILSFIKIPFLFKSLPGSSDRLSIEIFIS